MIVKKRKSIWIKFDGVVFEKIPYTLLAEFFISKNLSDCCSPTDTGPTMAFIKELKGGLFSDSKIESMCMDFITWEAENRIATMDNDSINHIKQNFGKEILELQAKLDEL